ncbi:MAG: phenylalanine--tRNA ligase subunit beta [Alphaproteobacteria bacterium]|nr:phenylalanine--tRNA ligase subunit beta [Alphaproteobacteria bacterium]
MKFTINGLKRHLETSASAEEICETLTAIGLEVEEFEDKALAYAPFKVAYVETAAPHPDADKLQVLSVQSDQGTLQVVCGAPNARAGMKGVFAPEGTYIPGLDVTLKKTKIRGVESNGMMVSEKEMNLSDEHKGIIEVDDRYEVGTPMAEIFGLDEQLVEINLTPNRVDCAGVRGVARDLAAAGIGTLKAQDESAVAGTFDSPIGVTIEDTQGCPLFLGRLVRNVKNGPSPKWLQDLLKGVGLRPISALVDITNLMSIEQCRPLHVYDADKLQGGIVVRSTKGGEALEALNDKSYEAVQDAVGIFDGSGLIGFGGIVGGVSTGSSDETVNVFIESAYFEPMRIARAGRAMGIESDARYRFERGVDPVFTRAGMELATRLVLELCGTPGTEVSHVVEAGAVPGWARTIAFDPAYTEKLCGICVETERQIEILTSLGFAVNEIGGQLQVQPPSWRGDVEGKADLAEEVARIVGYDHIPPVSVRSDKAVTAAAETLTLSRARVARSAMAVRGLEECVTWSFMPKDKAALFGSNDNPALTLANPISADLDQMRPSLLPNLIEAAQRNADRGFSDSGLCEVGPAFLSSKADGQAFVAAGVRAGNKIPRNWAGDLPARDADVFDAKADALAVLAACGAPADNAIVSRDAPDYYHPGRSGVLRLGKNVLAQFGEIHPGVLEEMGVKGRVVGFEVFLQNIPAPRNKGGFAKPLLKLSAFQPVARDFAFVVDEAVEADSLVRAAKSADKGLIVAAEVFDVYRGKGLEDGKKSLALSVMLQPVEATLTDKDIEDVSAKIIDAVAEKAGGVLRR